MEAYWRLLREIRKGFPEEEANVASRAILIGVNWLRYEQWAFSYFYVSMLFGSGLGHVTCSDKGTPANFMQADTWNVASVFFLGALPPPEKQAQTWETRDLGNRDELLQLKVILGQQGPAEGTADCKYVHEPWPDGRSWPADTKKNESSKWLFQANGLWGGSLHSIIVAVGNWYTYCLTQQQLVK